MCYHNIVGIFATATKNLRPQELQLRDAQRLGRKTGARDFQSSDDALLAAMSQPAIHGRKKLRNQEVTTITNTAYDFKSEKDVRAGSSQKAACSEHGVAVNPIGMPRCTDHRGQAEKRL